MGLGKHFGEFRMPETLDIQRYGSFLILDSKYNWITKFKPTKYAQLINNAIISQINRKYEQADAYWKEALKYTTRSDLVFNGIADSLTKNEDYKDALNYYQIANNRTDYSKAFSGFRDLVLTNLFTYIVIGLIILVVIIFIAPKIRRYLKVRRKQ